MLRLSTLLAVACLFGCAAKQATPPPVIYTVTGFDASTNIWIMDRVDASDKTHVQFVLVCDFYKAHSHPTVSGPTACDLTAGERIVPNPLQMRPGEYVDVWPRQDVLSITRGDGKDRVEEQFTIKSAKNLPFQPQ